jgi:DNA-binding CsgD family transcriptional regulator
MLSAIRREKLAGDILRTTFEASTLKDLSGGILPLFEKLFNTSVSILYQCNDRRELIGIGGATEVHRIYAERYFSSDPMRNAIQRLNRKILVASHCPEWKVMLKRPIYLEHAKHCGVDDYLLLRLTEAMPFNQGMVGLLLARTLRQPRFGEQEYLTAARLMPALEALVRRDARVQELVERHSILEGMIEADPRPRIAFDIRGKLIWASERAQTLMGFKSQGTQCIPEVLFAAVRRLGALAGKNASSSPIPYVCIKGQKGEPMNVGLRLARSRTGEPFVLAELELTDISPRVAEMALRFGLTAAETHVLGLLAQGLPDQKICGRLFVSLATVRTHVARIYSKLGVNSRVQAALLAYGLKFENTLDDTDSSPIK